MSYSQKLQARIIMFVMLARKNPSESFVTKKAGIDVTAEVSPHHLLLSENDIPGDDADWKMNPPLRGEDDLQALREGLLDGTLDVIATDHAPHTAEEKAAGTKTAPFGITGLETAFPLLYTNFVKKGNGHYSNWWIG